MKLLTFKITKYLTITGPPWAMYTLALVLVVKGLDGQLSIKLVNNINEFSIDKLALITISMEGILKTFSTKQQHYRRICLTVIFE